MINKEPVKEKAKFVKKWFKEKDKEQLYLPSYFYLATDKQKGTLYAFLIIDKLFHLFPDVEELTKSEMEMVKKDLERREKIGTDE